MLCRRCAAQSLNIRDMGWSLVRRNQLPESEAGFRSLRLPSFDALQRFPVIFGLSVQTLLHGGCAIYLYGVQFVILVCGNDDRVDFSGLEIDLR